MKRYRLRITMIFSLICMLYACSLEDDITPLSGNSLIDEGVKVKIGKQLKNPYSVANMKIAWSNLQEQNPQFASEVVDIKPTHVYVKFYPKNEEELDLLNREESLILYSYPLDHEILNEGESYRESGIPNSQPTPQYASVEVGQELPSGVAYEVLSELFIPDDRSDNASGRVASEWIVDELVHEALRITDNLESPDQDVSTKSSSSRTEMDDWRPSGRIRVWENVGTSSYTRRVLSHYEEYTCIADLREDTGFSDAGGNISPPTLTTCRRPVYRYEQIQRDGQYVGVHDVEVRARRWFTTHTGKTDINGRFQVNGTFKNDANYSLKWEKYHFSVRSGTIGQAEDNGPKIRSSWNRDYGRAGSTSVVDKQQYYALVFQAARDYYYGPRFGLSSPPQNGALKPQVKIAAHTDETDKDSHASQYTRTGGILPSVLLREWNRTSDRVYAITAHELAHLAHWDLNRDLFRLLVLSAYRVPSDNLRDNGEPFAAIIESWAVGVEWSFAQARYRDLLRVNGYRYRDNFQRRRINDNLIYTSLVIDLIDDENQRAELFNGDGAWPVDRVDGYTLRQIEQSLRTAGSWDLFRINLMNQHQNGSEEFLEELFGNWH